MRGRLQQFKNKKGAVGLKPMLAFFGVGVLRVQRRMLILL